MTRTFGLAEFLLILAAVRWTILLSLVAFVGGGIRAARLAKASTHWLRHTHASHAIAGGMPIEVAQQNVGHASLATTTVYVKTEQKRRMKAVKKFWEARAGR